VTEPYVDRRCIEVISTKRSAHHAFITWIADNSDRPMLFFNNVAPSLPPRMREADLLNSDTDVHVTDPEKRLLLGPEDAVINFEGKFLSSVERWNACYLSPRLHGTLCRIIFLRDPVNCFASLARRVTRRDARRCIMFFSQVLAFESILAGMKDSAAHDRGVSFSRWIADDDYRRDLAHFLRLRGTELPSRVTTFGGGSSFAGMSFEPARDSAALLKRWQTMARDPLYLAAFADDRSVTAMESYFASFGGEKDVGQDAVRELRERALKDVAARRFQRRYLEPLRRARAQLEALDRSYDSRMREFWRAVIRLRVAAGV
jgi:hypothetical protein